MNNTRRYNPARRSRSRSADINNSYKNQSQNNRRRNNYSSESGSRSASHDRDRNQRHHRNDEAGKRVNQFQNSNRGTQQRRASVSSQSHDSLTPPQQANRQQTNPGFAQNPADSQIGQNGNYASQNQVQKSATQGDLASEEEVVVDAGAFSNFPQITEASKEGLQARGITSLFPVQHMTFNKITEREDLMVRDLTGSGKTLAFCLPMVEYCRKHRYFNSGKPIAMILAPTRELALQISKELNLLRHNDREFSVLTVYGGVSIDDQTYALRRGVDFFVGTTGRIKDHIERQNFNFSNLKVAILDEADQMLHLGFREDVEKIMSTIKQHGPADLQTLLFSATIPPWVSKVASTFMKPTCKMLDLVTNLKNKTSRTVEHLAINCPYHNRVSALADILICYGHGQSIVFTSTKLEANSLLLSEKMKKDVEVMHGDIAQNQREVTLKRFKEKKFSVLVATDVAARGLDIPSVDLVVQVEPPKDTETYIHRSGRTARAGREGTCITFYTIKQKNLVQMIEQQAGIKFTKIGVPQPEQVIKASFYDINKQLKEDVNDDVVQLFEEGAETLIKQEDGDSKRALCKLLALVSGHHKQVMKARSLLSGTEDQVTFYIKLRTTFYSVSMVWNLLRKYLPDQVHTQVRGMRAFKDMTGACFDVPENYAQRIEDSYNYVLDQRGNLDFDMGIAKDLPELKEDDYNNQGGHGGGGYQGRGGRGGYGDQRGGYGGNNYSSGYQGRGGYNQDRGGYNSYGRGGGSFRGGSDSYGGRGGGGYDNDRGYGGGRGGGGYGRGGGDRGGDRGGGGDHRGGSENSVFVGNLGQDADQRKVEGIFASQELKPLRVRVLTDESGKPKGAAFVDFQSSDDAQRACRLDGKSFPGTHPRGLRVNPANNRPQR